MVVVVAARSPVAPLARTVCSPQASGTWKVTVADPSASVWTVKMCRGVERSSPVTVSFAAKQLNWSVTVSPDCGVSVLRACCAACPVQLYGTACATPVPTPINAVQPTATPNAPRANPVMSPPPLREMSFPRRVDGTRPRCLRSGTLRQITRRAQPRPCPRADPASSKDSAWRATMNEGSEPAPGRVGVRLRRRRQWLLIACPALTIVAIGWLAVTALIARADLAHARGDLVAMRTAVHGADMSDTRQRAVDLRSRLGRAHLLTRGPVWRGVAAIPVAGAPFRSVRGMTSALDTVGDRGVPALIAVADQLDPKTLRDPQGRIAVNRVSTAVPDLARAGAALDDAVARVSALPRHTWLSTVDSARELLLRQLSPAIGDLRAAQQAADLVPALLAEDKSYLLSFQNNAEARPTGAMPGAFALARVHDGRITLDRFAGEGSLSGITAKVQFGADYDALYPQQVTQRIYQDANLSPHFPYGAAILASMWQQRFGEKVDGVIALDPVVLSYLLRATGPVLLPDGSTATADNIVALTEEQVYAKFPGPANNGRRDYLARVEQAVSTRIMSSDANPGELMRGLRRSIDARRLLIWSADTALQRRLERTPVSGAIPITRAPYVGVSIVNEAGNKLDYYLDRTIR